MTFVSFQVPPPGYRPGFRRSGPGFDQDGPASQIARHPQRQRANPDPSRRLHWSVEDGAMVDRGGGETVAQEHPRRLALAHSSPKRRRLLL